MLEQEQGVVFPTDADGRRSTTATGRAIWADAVRGVDPALAARLEAQGDWRTGYLRAVVDVTAAGTRSPETSLETARAGLASVAQRLRFTRDGSVASLAEALRDGAGPPLATGTVRGGGERVRELVLPCRGEALRGDALRRRLDTWVARGTIEPSCGQALHAVLDNPSWLDLSDRAFALLGAGAQMGPYDALLGWGASVAAVDVPGGRGWEALLRTARSGAGTVVVPLLPGEREVGRATVGADLLRATPEVAQWLTGVLDGLPLTVGSYAYADGAAHVLLAAAGDAVVERLTGVRAEMSYAELATPTDAYAVPASVVDDARGRWSRRGWRAVAQAPLRAAGRGRLYAPSYDVTVTREDGAQVGVADALVAQQGPNYSLAKRIQRWRAAVAQDAGVRVSANVAPATQTASVLSNRVLAAAYAGAGRFGVEVFAPDTSRMLMAALLVHDLRADAPPPPHPDDLLVQGAAHSGLWRMAYSPRSVLGIAAVTGLASVRR